MYTAGIGVSLVAACSGGVRGVRILHPLPENFMKQLEILVLALGLTTLVACGGDDGSGVDGSKTIVGMSASEKQSFCEWAIAEQGGAGAMTTCGDVTITVQTVADCVAGFADFTATCAATVAQGEACIAATASNPCEFGGAACAPIFACIPQ